MQRTAPFRNVFVTPSASPVRLQIGGVRFIESNGALPRGTVLHFTEPTGDPSLNYAVPLDEVRVIPCETVSECWLVFPAAGTGEIDTRAELRLWYEGEPSMLGAYVRTAADALVMEQHAADRNKTLPNTPALPLLLAESHQANFAKGTALVGQRSFNAWVSSAAAFRVILSARTFAGSHTEVRTFDSAAMPNGGHGLFFDDGVPGLGWRLNAYSLGAAQVGACSWLVATTAT